MEKSQESRVKNQERKNLNCSCPVPVFVLTLGSWFLILSKDEA